MPPVDPAGFGRISHHWQSSDTSWSCGHDFMITGAFTQSDLDDLAAAFSTYMDAELVPKFSYHVTYIGATVYVSDGTSVIEGTSTTDHNGSDSDDPAPLNCCILASIKIGAHYRGGKPRTYFSGVSRAQLSSDRNWPAGYVGDFETGWAAYLAGVAAYTSADILTCSPGVVARYRAHTLLDPPYFIPYTGSKVQRRICSQRRRLGRLL